MGCRPEMKSNNDVIKPNVIDISSTASRSNNQNSFKPTNFSLVPIPMSSSIYASNDVKNQEQSEQYHIGAQKKLTATTAKFVCKNQEQETNTTTIEDSNDNKKLSFSTTSKVKNSKRSEKKRKFMLATTTTIASSSSNHQNSSFLSKKNKNYNKKNNLNHRNK